jgi:hypothetical protein
MVSAGLDMVPTMLIYFIGHMSQVYGQGIQQSAYHAIQDAFSDGESWSGCLQDGSIPYIQALNGSRNVAVQPNANIPSSTVNKTYQVYHKRWRSDYTG